MKDKFDEIHKLYTKFRKKGLDDIACDLLLKQIILKSISLLATLEQTPLHSKVPSKTYFAFQMYGANKLSRPINTELYYPDMNLWDSFTEGVRSGSLLPGQRDDISKVLYTAAISFCAVNDLFKVGDQKTPGTFFEHFISYLFKLCLKVTPVTSIPVLDYDGVNVSLPTDRIFNLGRDLPKFHVPIKTSSRERAIMLWAHQKLLDGVYGIEKFVGTPVLLAENKTDSKSREVMEICLPDQWLVYQLYISKLKRIYYLDMPDAYRRLTTATPPIHVKPFADFFFEWQDIYC